MIALDRFIAAVLLVCFAIGVVAAVSIVWLVVRMVVGRQADEVIYDNRDDD